MDVTDGKTGWIVIRERCYDCGGDLPSGLEHKIKEFYKEHLRFARQVAQKQAAFDRERAWCVPGAFARHDQKQSKVLRALDFDDDTKLRYADGSESGYVKFSQLHQSNSQDYERAAAEHQQQLQRERAKRKREAEEEAEKQEHIAKRTRPVPAQATRIVSKIWGGPRWDSSHGECSVLTPGHPDHSAVERLFRDGWRHPRPRPRIAHILKLRPREEIKRAFDQKRAEYEEKFGDSMEVRQFHGTKLSCLFGVDPNQPPCTSADCSVCRIVQRGFQIQRCGSRDGGGTWLRFGCGTYFSPVSSKSDDYTDGSVAFARCGKLDCSCGPHPSVGFQGQRYKAMFLCRVLKGLPFVAYTDCPDGLASPAVREDPMAGSFTSMEGLAGKHRNMVHDELVVYSSEQAIPSHLIIYEVP